MSFPRYPKYKDSGAEWLGEVPEHWEVRRLRQIGPLLKGCGGSKEDVVETGVPCVRYGDLYTTHAYFIRQARTCVTEERSVDYFPVRRGDVLFAASGEDLAEIGRSAVVLFDERACCGGDLVVLRPDVSAVPEFMGYACDCWVAKAQKASMGRGTTVKHIYPDELKRLLLAVPPLPEQAAIAAFLDRETTKIDALIADQQRLIELLQEKRQAVISHAVTKGLNPDAPMKDSGIEWLGEVPEHWDIMPVWLLFELGRGRVISHCEIADNPGPYPVYSSQTENDGVMGNIGTFAYDGDYLTWTTDGANAGTVFRRSGRFNCTNVCGTLKDRSGRMLLDYAHRAIQSATGYFVRHDINPKLMNNVMSGIRIPVPSLQEQRDIASRVAAVGQLGDTLSAEMGWAITLLQERRSALISAAVTGQIDVRGLAGSEAA